MGSRAKTRHIAMIVCVPPCGDPIIIPPTYSMHPHHAKWKPSDHPPPALGTNCHCYPHHSSEVTTTIPCRRRHCIILIHLHQYHCIRWMNLAKRVQHVGINVDFVLLLHNIIIIPLIEYQNWIFIQHTTTANDQDLTQKHLSNSG